MARWSLDDTMLAVASEDRRIAVYNSSGDASGEKPSEYKLMYKLLGFESPPTSIDFSIGNEYMRCAAAPSGAILYCRPGGIQKTVGGSIQPDLISEGHYIQVKDVMWTLQTLCLRRTGIYVSTNCNCAFAEQRQHVYRNVCTV